MQYGHAHHDNSVVNYEYHVIRIGNHDFCIGCTATRSFIALTLPLIMILVSAFWLQINDRFFLSLLPLYLLTITIYVYEYYTGGHLDPLISALVQYTFLGIILYQMILIDLFDPAKSYLMLGMILVLTIPQYFFYIRKVFKRKEFTHNKIKFVIREFFLIGNWFLLLLLPINNQIQVLVSFFIVFAIVTVFLGLRNYSNKLVAENFRLLVGDDCNHSKSSFNDITSFRTGGPEVHVNSTNTIDKDEPRKMSAAAKRRERGFGKLRAPPSRKKDLLWWIIIPILIWSLWSNEAPSELIIFMMVVFLILYKYRESLPKYPICCDFIG
ncbi:MAG: hypothetical protein HeimC2_44920 [Candidatus Heimdallarchaeota archaeon LC_2]|nr:MAG: hypothetical protein HeimC2_44920 [Candidatus Heimdallarchaeota archaeon LC_2]